MPNSSFAFKCLIVLFLACGLRVAAGEEDLFKKRISVEAQIATPVEYITLLLRQSGAPGGIEDFQFDCQGEPTLKIPSLEGSVADGLGKVQQQVKALSWRVVDNAILVVKGKPTSSILETTVAEFNFNPDDPPNKVTNSLLRTPEVANSLSQNGVSLGSPELGFAQPGNNSHEQIKLKDVNVRQILDSVARSSHPRVWLFQQRTCGKITTITINWVVK